MLGVIERVSGRLMAERFESSPGGWAAAYELRDATQRKMLANGYDLTTYRLAVIDIRPGDKFQGIFRFDEKE